MFPCFLLVSLIAEDKDGEEHDKILAEGEEGKRGDSGDEGAVGTSGEDGEERSTLEEMEGDKEVDNTVWIHFEDFLELFRFVSPSCRIYPLYSAVNLKHSRMRASVH